MQRQTIKNAGGELGRRTAISLREYLGKTGGAGKEQLWKRSFFIRLLGNITSLVLISSTSGKGESAVKKVTALLLTISLIFASLILAPVAGAEELIMESEPDEAVDAAIWEETAVTDVSGMDIPVPSAILLEKETGQVIFEKDADKKLVPASVTKVMTILLIVEAVDSGRIKMDDMVPVSARAASMGGSQVYLEEGESMSVHDMLKCIVVSSANDAAVAMAELLCGTEQEFSARMNQRAEELGCTGTNFNNCTGLMDDPEHVTTARDIALMSRELISHDWIKEFTTIWMDTIRDGSFGLSNTNKLIRYFDGATGLKTGYTSAAGHCLSATAMRDGVEFIAVVLNGASSQERFESAKTLLSYGFSNYALVDAAPDRVLPPVNVTLGEYGTVQPVLEADEKLLLRKEEAQTVQKSVELTQGLTAPVAAGQKMGSLKISSAEGKVLKEINIVAANEVLRLSWGDIFANMLKIFFFGTE